MAVEIERKFLLRSGEWRELASSSVRIVQGYLANTCRSSIRLRLAGETATLSVKSMTPGMCREEYEFPVAVTDARRMLDTLCEGPQVEKTRHIVTVAEHRFEIDEFAGDNEGLIVAEVELGSEDEQLVLPGWLGDEVTDEARYYNFLLARYPYRRWPAADREAARCGLHRDSAKEATT